MEKNMVPLKKDLHRLADIITKKVNSKISELETMFIKQSDYTATTKDNSTSQYKNEEKENYDHFTSEFRVETKTSKKDFEVDEM